MARCLLIAVCLLLGSCTSTGPKDLNQELTREDLRLEIRKPRGQGPFPTVVIMHGCSGLTPGTRLGIEAHARHLNTHGYIAVILDSADVTGKAVCDSFEALEFARYYRAKEAIVTFEYLKNQPGVDRQNIFLLGRSNGGSAALIAGKEHFTHKYKQGDDVFKGVVAYYPWCGMGLNYLILPALVLVGRNDDWISADECVQYSARGRQMGVVEIEVYENAYHGFDTPIPLFHYLGHTIGHNPAADVE